MTALRERLSRIVTFPIRVITAPFRAVSNFLNQEPEEADAGDILALTFERPQLLVDHLEALRHHLLRALVFMVITTGLSFAFARQILEFLTSPVGGLAALRSIEVTESIGAFMRVSLLSGLVLALPYILFEAFLFVNPALRPPERKLVIVLIPVGTLLFVSGMAFAYFVMLPAALPFLINFMGIQAELRPSSYIQFVTSILFWIGVAFEFPLIVYILASIGLVRGDTLWRGWRVAIVAIAVLSAAITPTIDPINMGLVMAPMTLLYFLSIGLAFIAQRNRLERASSAA
jgi:sec-independent protein translocase protein TatC